MVFKWGKMPIQFGGKSTFFHRYQDRWQQPVNTLEYASFPGTTTPNMSSARIVARSLTPKSFVTWRLKRPPNQNPARKTPEAQRRLGSLRTEADTRQLGRLERHTGLACLLASVAAGAVSVGAHAPGRDPGVLQS